MLGNKKRPNDETKQKEKGKWYCLVFLTLAGVKLNQITVSLAGGKWS